MRKYQDFCQQCIYSTLLLHRSCRYVSFPDGYKYPNREKKSPNEEKMCAHVRNQPSLPSAALSPRPRLLVASRRPLRIGPRLGRLGVLVVLVRCPEAIAYSLSRLRFVEVFRALASTREIDWSETKKQGCWHCDQVLRMNDVHARGVGAADK